MIHHLKSARISREASLSSVQLQHLISLSSSLLVTFYDNGFCELTVNQETGGANKNQILVLGTGFQDII